MPQAKDMHIDVPLSNLAIQLGSGGGFVADIVFPVLSVQKESDKYYIFEREEISDDVQTLRADGAEADEIEWSTTTDTYSAEEYALRHLVTRRSLENADSPLRPKQTATRKLLGKIRLGIEKRINALINNTTTFENASPSTKWDDTSPTIEKDVDDGKLAFVKQCGHEPTHIIIPKDVSKVVKRDSTVRELVKYTQSNLLVNGDLPPTLWNMKVVIPGALQNEAAPGLTESIDFIWDDDNVILAYVDPNPALDVCSLGYQFRKAQEGKLDIVVTTYLVPNRKGEMVEVSVINDEEIVCTECGYILNNVLT